MQYSEDSQTLYKNSSLNEFCRKKKYFIIFVAMKWSLQYGKITFQVRYEAYEAYEVISGTSTWLNLRLGEIPTTN